MQGVQGHCRGQVFVNLYYSSQTSQWMMRTTLILCAVTEIYG